MKIFIPTNEMNERWLNNGFSFKPFIIEAYDCHLSDLELSEKTQNLFNKKVNTGTTIINKGNT